MPVGGALVGVADPQRDVLMQLPMMTEAIADAILDWIDEDTPVLDEDEAFDRAAEYMHMVMPRQRSVLTRYVERRPIFHHYRIEEQLDVDALSEGVDRLRRLVA